MSVETEFQRRRDQVKDQLDDIIREVSILISDKDIWGYEDMSDEYMLDMTEALGLLVSARRKI